jgi:hypothetical protein
MSFACRCSDEAENTPTPEELLMDENTTVVDIQPGGIGNPQFSVFDDLIVRASHYEKAEYTDEAGVKQKSWTIGLDITAKESKHIRMGVGDETVVGGYRIKVLKIHRGNLLSLLGLRESNYVRIAVTKEDASVPE